MSELASEPSALSELASEPSALSELASEPSALSEPGGRQPAELAEPAGWVGAASEPSTQSEPSTLRDVDPADLAAVTVQLGRPPRGVRAVAHRCPCGLPSVVETAPRLDDGTPFPTLYYLTCPRLASRIGTLEAQGRMREMSDRLAGDPDLGAAYRKAHGRYLAERDAIEPLGTDVSAGGMPDRVKCLHVHAAQALAAGPGVNPFGDEVLAEIGDWWRAGPCVTP